MPGKIVTFYSYKGGVGRSMTLANVAWILASHGKSVLAIDWHIDAPGLHRYFAPFLIDRQLTESRGVMEFVSDYALEVTKSPEPRGEVSADILRYAVSVDWKFEQGGGIDLVPAGRAGVSYSVAVSSFDWVHFYERIGGAAFLDAAKREMRKEYDYVLIDSQSGIGQASAICTVHMPDILVVCCGLNRQNMMGAAAVARSVSLQRQTDPCLIFPMLMRVDWAEKAMLDNARQQAAREFEPMLGHIADKAKYWSEVEVPYTPYYSYVEVLAPFVESSRGTASILGSAERIAGYITGGEVVRAEPLDESTRQIGLEAFLNDSNYNATPAALLNLSDYFLQAAAFDRAVKVATDAIEAQPNNPDAYAARGTAYWYAGKQREAIDDFTRELQLQPNSAVALSGRGQCFAETGEFAKAVEDLVRAIELTPDNTFVAAYSRNGLALAYAGLRRFDEALKTFDESLKTAPDNAWAYFNRALAHEWMKETGKAREDYRTSLEKQDPPLTPWKREYAEKRLSRPPGSSKK
jgi:tetratricopeptide (TPR) repeat protein